MRRSWPPTPVAPPETIIRSTFSRTQVRGKIRKPIKSSLGESVLEGEILSLDPAKLVHLLPERLQEGCVAGSTAIIQETDAKDFLWLLRLNAKGRAQRAWRKE